MCELFPDENGAKPTGGVGRVEERPTLVVGWAALLLPTKIKVNLTHSAKTSTTTAQSGTQLLRIFSID